MLKKEWLCNLLLKNSLRQSTPLSTYYTKGKTQILTFGGKNSYSNLKWTWRNNRPKLLTCIASNKNVQLSNRNLGVMIGATNAQCPKYATNTMSFEEMKPIPRTKNGEKNLMVHQNLLGIKRSNKKEKFKQLTSYYAKLLENGFPRNGVESICDFHL